MLAFDVGNEYNDLSPLAKVVLDNWLRKYNLEDRAALIKQTDYNDGWINVKLEVYDLPLKVRHRLMGSEKYLELEECNEFRLLDTFEYDDFPWEVL